MSTTSPPSSPPSTAVSFLFSDLSGSLVADWLDLFNFNVVDTLKVPDAPGDYVLSWRWDCEQVIQRLRPQSKTGGGRL